MRELERLILLRVMDSKWMEHLRAMDDLRGKELAFGLTVSGTPLMESCSKPMRCSRLCSRRCRRM